MTGNMPFAAPSALAEAIRPPLVPLPVGCVVGAFLRRHNRFSVEIDTPQGRLWIHSNNSGSMLGLTRPGAPVLASPAANPARKLKYTQECVWLARTACPPRRAGNGAEVVPRPLIRAAGFPVVLPPSATDGLWNNGFWVGVNTSVPNRMLEAAFKAGRLPFAVGYSTLTREARRGQSRLDGLFTGSGLPPLWVECKNVTLVEDDAACFPDAGSERGRKHLRELMDIAAHGERAAMFYLVQRPDGRCFAPADCIDPEYAALFQAAMASGVEMYPFRALVSPAGVDLGALLPVRA